MTFKNVMIDLETLDDRPEAVVLSIGAVFFDDEQLGDTFYRVLSFDDQLALGRKVSASTIRWWMGQSEQARQVFHAPETYQTHTALVDFRYRLLHHDSGSPYVWGNGAGFDLAILKSLYLQFNMLPPWDFRRERCFRTAAAMSDLRRTAPAHNALDDAAKQALHLIELSKEFPTIIPR
jgi:hypothetical protein